MAHNEAMRAGVWWSEGSQTLYEVPEAPYRWTGLALGDVNSDGIGDLVLADPTHGLVVIRSYVPPLADTDPPETVISGGPSGTVNQRGATFTFSSDEPASTFECSMNNGPRAPCTSPQSFGPLADQTHEFLVVATDAAGNVDPTPARRTFNVDTQAPETTITSGPSGTISSTSATFSFGATEPATFQCALNGSQFAPCTSPKTYSNLADGAYQFQVRASDPATNTDPSPAVRTFTVERPSDLAGAL